MRRSDVHSEICKFVFEQIHLEICTRVTFVFGQIYAGWHANATASVKEAIEADFGMNWKQFVGAEENLRRV